jgi:hypothetical protein
MPALCFYALGADYSTLLQRLNEDQEIAFITWRRGGRWVAARTAERIADGETWLWHLPAGPLHASRRPVGLGDVLVRGPEIASPWDGWSAQGIPCEQGPESFRLVVYRRMWPDDRIPLASLQWSGDRSAQLGRKAAPETHLWWKRMERWFGSAGRRISRVGAHDSQPPRGLAAFALPVAHQAIVGGRARSDN